MQYRTIALTVFLTSFALFSFPSRVTAMVCGQSGPRLRLACEFTRKPSTETSFTQTFSEPEIPADSIVTGVTYGWIEDYAYFYDRPSPGARHVRTASSGFFYGPAVESVADDSGKAWYKVWDDWLPERYYHQVETSEFKGVEVNRQPERPFGWMLRPFTPRPGPAGDAAPGTAELQRYDFVQMYEWARGSDGNLWYDIGPGGWVRYDTVALTTVRDRPGDVGPEDYWVDVDLTQQIFAAYEGDRLVYAGLVSSGLPRWATRTGLNQVWLRHETTPMEGGIVGDDYYYIDAVPHTMYFDGEIALHGAFWHDDFGRPKSHGCVNMPPRAAEWVFNWSEDAPNDLWVWVHYADHSDTLY